MGCDLGAEYLLRNYLESSRVHQYPIPPMYPTIYLPLITYIWIRVKMVLRVNVIYK
jgi:hypothetical protein